MSKRPLCLLAIFLVTLFFCLDFLGVSWIWRSPKGHLPEQLATDEKEVILTGIVYRQEDSILYIKETDLWIHSNQYPIRNVKCFTKEKCENLLGSQVTVAGVFVLPKCPTNLGEFNEKQYERARKIDYHLEETQVLEADQERGKPRRWIQRLKVVGQNTLKKIFPEKEAGVLETMIFGEKGNLDPKIKMQYQAAGISHMISISGLHISLLSMSLWKLLRKRGMSMGMSALLALVVLFFYSIMIENPTTAFRAVLMFCVMLGAKLIGRTYDLLSALAFACILLLLDNPDLLYDGGFQLSFTAILGMQQGQGKEKGISLWLFTLPVVLYHFYQVSVIGIVLNLVLIPLVPILLTGGIAAMCIGILHVWTGSILGIPVWILLKVCEYSGILAERIPFAVWTPGQPSWGNIVVYYLGLAGFFYLQKKGNKIRWLLPFVLCLVLSGSGGTKHQITMLDVGQGDGFVLQSDGAAVLIDGGSSSRSKVGTYVILPYLKQQGISRVDGIFISHSDEDHVNGIKEVLEEARKGWLKVTYVFMPRWMKETEEGIQLEILGKQSGVNVCYLHKGEKVVIKNMVFSVLHPGSDFPKEDTNGGSLVLRGEIQGISMLFTGDLPLEYEEAIQDNIEEADILKVAHHGSRGSSSESFLRAASPSVALISAGKRNVYGHPAKEVLDRLEKQACRIYQTPASGMVTLDLSGAAVK